MKQLLLLLSISFALLSCSKSKDDDMDDDKTTVNFINKLPRSFGNVVIGSWTGGDGKLIKSVGTLPEGGSTGEIVIKDQSLTVVYFFYDDNGKTYVTPYGFGIGQGTFNNWEINGNVIFDQINKSDQIYPK